MQLKNHICAAHARDIGDGFCTQAARDDHFPIGGQRLADRVKAFLDGFIYEATGVDDYQISAFKRFGRLIAFCTELRQD